MKRCGESGKLKFKTKADALVKALRVSYSDEGKRVGGAYFCRDCGFWHLTSKVRTGTRLDTAEGQGRR